MWAGSSDLERRRDFPLECRGIVMGAEGRKILRTSEAGSAGGCALTNPAVQPEQQRSRHIASFFPGA